MGNLALEEEEVLGLEGSSHLQCLHVLINPGGLFLQAGDGVFCTDQSTVDPTLGRMGDRNVMGVWTQTPTQRKTPELGGGSVYTLILPWSGCVTLGQGCTSLILGISAL